jgi:glycosyltransferase involved in cell wall biosynthesis
MERLTIVHGLYAGNFFGAARYLVDLAKLQSEAGHEVHILAARGAQMTSAFPASVTVHELGLIRRTFGLRKVIDALKPDVLHGHLGRASKAFGRMRTRPAAVATMHLGYKPHQYRGLDGLIALHKQAEAAAASFHGPVERIWNWAPALAPVDQDARATVRAELGIPEDGFVVGFLGRLHPSKNPDMLVRAFRAAAGENTWLVMAGEGDLRPVVEGAAAGADNIKIIGYRTDVPRLYQAYDLLAFPSREEQMPMVLLEAMAASLPIVATRIDGPAEFLPQPEAVLFESEDEAALTKILKEQFALGQRRQKYDMTPFDPKGQSDKIKAFYRRVMSARSVEKK